MRKLLLVVGLFVLVSYCAGPVSADIALVQNNRSDYTIVVPADAPGHLLGAAREMRTVVRLATNAELEIREDSEEVAGRVVSLGSTRQARESGLSVDDMDDESYRIVTRDGDLFILGPDTPDGGWTRNNGVSAGTANGVYVLLEEELDVRWLMPGDLGRDVPRADSVVLPEMDRRETPVFSYRNVTHLRDYANKEQTASIRAWSDAHRLGGATQFSHNHYWWPTLNDNRSSQADTPDVKAIYEKHPEWFAMNAHGERPLPTSHYEKLETTNQELVRWYAMRAIERLKASERPLTYSLSPSDGGRWSESPESKALYDPSPSQLFDPEAPAGAPGMSSLVLKWYHDVAKIVQKEYPEGRLSGYIYASYVYPPQKVQMKLPDNFTPVICGIGTYGYGLYRPENQKRWLWVMEEWSKVAPRDWFYYDLPNQMLRQQEYEIGPKEANFPGSSGVITPAAPDILNLLFPHLVKCHIKGTNIYGVPSWGNAALANYLLAKMNWNPLLDAYELQREWLTRAYGTRAGAVMEELQNRLNGLFKAYFEENKTVSYKLSSAMLRDIYAANYAELETLLLRAKAQPMTDAQARRLIMQEENLSVLQWRLRNLGFLAEDFESPLRLDDAGVEALVVRDDPEFAHFPGVVTQFGRHRAYLSGRLPWRVKLTSESLPAAGADLLPGMKDCQYLIYSAVDRDVEIKTESVEQGPYFPIYFLQDARAKVIKKGIIRRDAPLVFSAKAGQAYVLTLPDRKPVKFSLMIEGAAVGNAKLEDKTLWLSKTDAEIYVLFAPGSAPMGLNATAEGARMLKPYSGGTAGKVLRKRYKRVRVLNSLDSGWKFSPDPADEFLSKGVLTAGFDDKGWAALSALEWWQMQGFGDYRGVGWYRMRFMRSELSEQEDAELVFGTVDGHMEAYINGEKVLERELPRNFKGWNKPLSCTITDKLQPGENTLVVKVVSKDDKTASGLLDGVNIMAGVKR